MVEIKVLVELVGFCSRVAEETLLIEFFRDLLGKESLANGRDCASRGFTRTSRTFFGAI